VRDELLVLVRGERRADGVDEQPVELVAGEPLVCRLVEMWQGGRAELRVCVRLEVLVAEAAVRAELLLVGEVVAVPDLEPRTRLDVESHRPGVGEAERAPADERRDRPGEVVVQARQRDVRRRVRVVDRVHLTVAHDRLA
jgi:hypothetical protein